MTSQPLESWFHYHREGWVTLPALLSGSGLMAAREVCEQMMHQGVQSDAHWLMNPHTGERGHWLLDILQDERVASLLQLFCGEDVCLAASQFFVKVPRISRAVGWHQDGLDSVQGDFDPSLGRQALGPLTLWIALDDVCAENGGLHVLPRLHQAGQLSTCDMLDDSGVGVGITPEEITPHLQHAIGYRWVHARCPQQAMRPPHTDLQRLRCPSTWLYALPYAGCTLVWLLHIIPSRLTRAGRTSRSSQGGCLYSASSHKSLTLNASPMSMVPPWGMRTGTRRGGLHESASSCPDRAPIQQLYRTRLPLALRLRHYSHR